MIDLRIIYDCLRAQRILGDRLHCDPSSCQYWYSTECSYPDLGGLKRTNSEGPGGGSSPFDCAGPALTHHPELLDICCGWDSECNCHTLSEDDEDDDEFLLPVPRTRCLDLLGPQSHQLCVDQKANPLNAPLVEPDPQVQQHAQQSSAPASTTFTATSAMTTVAISCNYMYKLIA